eukprot:PhM_4_TR14077/c6_g1_i1/m.60804
MSSHQSYWLRAIPLATIIVVVVLSSTVHGVLASTTSTPTPPPHPLDIIFIWHNLERQPSPVPVIAHTLHRVAAEAAAEGQRPSSQQQPQLRVNNVVVMCHGAHEADRLEVAQQLAAVAGLVSGDVAVLNIPVHKAVSGDSSSQSLLAEKRRRRKKKQSLSSPAMEQAYSSLNPDTVFMSRSLLITHAVLEGARHVASDAHVLTIGVDHLISHPHFFREMLTALDSSQSILAVGATATHDHVVVHRGYNVHRANVGVVLSPELLGHDDVDDRITAVPQSTVAATSVLSGCLFRRGVLSPARVVHTITQNSWEGNEDLHEALGPEAAVWAWMLQQKPGAIVAVSATVEVLDAQARNPRQWPIPSDVVTTTTALSLPSNGALEVIWALYCCECCGFSNEALHLIYPLERYVNIKTTAGANCHCNGFPNSVLHYLDRVFIDKNMFASSSSPGVTVWVAHGDPYHITQSQWKEAAASLWPNVGDGAAAPREADYVVGRVMYEFTKLPDAWVRECNRADIDELWVPSEFVRQLFVDSGVERTRLVVLPESIDTHDYNPATHPKLVFPDALATHFKVFGTNRNEDAVGSGRSGVSATTTYKFMSMFKWEDRKGWDILIESYFSAFTRSDPVSLYLFTHVWYPGAPNTWGPSRSPDTVANMIYAFLEKRLRTPRPGAPPLTRHTLETYNDTLPHFVIVCDRLPEQMIPVIFNSFDAFVLPTRGEGWGLPMMQAMAMGLPTISSSWGGQTDFMTPTTAYLIRSDGTEEIGKDSYYGYEPGKRWGLPSAVHLAQLLRHVVSHPDEARRVGLAGRAHIQERYDDDAVARLYYARLQQIQQIVLCRKREGWKRPYVAPVTDEPVMQSFRVVDGALSDDVGSPGFFRTLSQALAELTLDDEGMPKLSFLALVFIASFVLTLGCIAFFCQNCRESAAGLLRCHRRWNASPPPRFRCCGASVIRGEKRLKKHKW